MTFMLDQEPTVAATVDDETQSLHAWSQEDAATDVVDYRPRGWKLPAMVATLAVGAAISAGVFLAWPHPVNPQVSATKPQVASPTKPTIVAPPPAQTISPDQRFLALVQQRGVQLVSPPAALKGAHDTCRLEAEGHSAKEIAQAFTDVTPGITLKTEGIFVMTAEEIYCPPKETP